MKLMQSVAATLICAVGLATQAGAEPADTNGSCSGPKAADEQTAIVTTPDYLAGNDESEAPDPQAEAAEKAWVDYQASVLDALRHSPAPRDWALATVAGLTFDKQSAAADIERDALLKRAMAAAPDDALVQWIAVMRLHPAAVESAASLRRLQLLEPGNAAVWLQTLIRAQKHNDAAGVDQALNRMASGSRFDGHFIDLSRALLDAYQRTPPAATVAAQDDPFRSARAAPYVYAASITTATALPAFQDLLNACRVDPRTGTNAQRSIDCAAAGRLMAARGDTLIANHIGLSMLRVSRTFSDDDVSQARMQDWLREQFTTKLLALAGSPDESAAEDMITYQTDWMETGSEVEAMRRAVARAGTPVTPPDDWTDKFSPFSEDRFQQDQAALQRVAGNH